MGLQIHEDFQPNIYDYAGSHGKQILDAWGVPHIGTPVHALPPHRAAFWLGGAYSGNNETIVIMATLHEGRKLEPQSIKFASFYFGIVTRSAVDRIPEPARPEHLADRATVACGGAHDEKSTPLEFMFDLLSAYAPPPTAPK